MDLNLGAGAIIGTKGLDEHPTLCAIELNELYVGGDALAKEVVQQGLPPEVPVGVPTRSFLRLSVTVKRYHDLAKKLVAAVEKYEADVAATGGEPDQSYEAHVGPYIEELKKLVNVGPPLATPSRVIIPK